MHACNNSVYLSTKKCSHELFKSYEANFTYDSESRILKKKTSLIIE